ncbi:hypothetical protein [Microvirga terrestris]|uniref:DUF4345 domain-containing protein n=1 Tax=Microvirga terrestris TaxID=2791024 RepID=A0ABS0HPD7_9HYPH|nr:hypothetical protein [Microvirga terrestris]MBF9195136.1 hypothetical protein [Microvirga terrestris]
MRAIAAGALYFAVIFALGFILGAARVLMIAPRLGETEAVLVELPIMLTASWIACGWVLRRLRVGLSLETRLAIGGVAFSLLMLAELGVSVLAFGRTPAEHLATYGSASALVGLGAQLIFAAMPLLRRTRSQV